MLTTKDGWHYNDETQEFILGWISCTKNEKGWNCYKVMIK